MTGEIWELKSYILKLPGLRKTISHRAISCLFPVGQIRCYLTPSHWNQWDLRCQNLLWAKTYYRDAVPFNHFLFWAVSFYKFLGTASSNILYHIMVETAEGPAIENIWLYHKLYVFSFNHEWGKIPNTKSIFQSDMKSLNITKARVPQCWEAYWSIVWKLYCGLGCMQ